MHYGYNGKILHVNLNELSYEIEAPSEEFYRTYMGGGGLTSYYPRKFDKTPQKVLQLHSSNRSD